MIDRIERCFKQCPDLSCCLSRYLDSRHIIENVVTSVVSMIIRGTIGYLPHRMLSDYFSLESHPINILVQDLPKDHPAHQFVQKIIHLSRCRESYCEKITKVTGAFFQGLGTALGTSTAAFFGSNIGSMIAENFCESGNTAPEFDFICTAYNHLRNNDFISKLYGYNLATLQIIALITTVLGGNLIQLGSRTVRKNLSKVQFKLEVAKE